jgi:hypothetical protein
MTEELHEGLEGLDTIARIYAKGNEEINELILLAQEATPKKKRFTKRLLEWLKK